VVGKGAPDSEPCIDLGTMIDLTCAAEVDGMKFDGIDLFLAAPHFDLDKADEEFDAVVEKVKSHHLEIGTVVAPIWGGSAMGAQEKRDLFLREVRRSCAVAKRLRDAGVRPNGFVRIDSSCSVEDWAKDPEANQKQIAETFTAACNIAEEYNEKLAAEGEICWGGMHSWKRMLQLLEMVDRPQTLGFQADMSHTLLFLLGYNAPEDRIVPDDFTWDNTEAFDAAYKTLTDALRPWTIDLHIAQNDGSVFGSGTHDKTGRHCLAKDPNGKLDITKYAGFWLTDENGPIKRFRNICWDGCMFPNSVMMNPQTWNDILEAMVNVRKAYGWN
ncbi:MAG: TIM barrel protein, partial [Thermoguttaceae bacterium]|nr:TIM barrel protein [Thermoguttaceae bacterium]